MSTKIPAQNDFIVHHTVACCISFVNTDERYSKNTSALSASVLAKEYCRVLYNQSGNLQLFVSIHSYTILLLENNLSSNRHLAGKNSPLK